MDWFKHDTNAASDPKIDALRVLYKGGAVDCYNVILETIYRDEQPYDLLGNQSAMRALAHKLSASVGTVAKWVEGMVDLGLFHIVVENDKHGKGLWSERCEREIIKYQLKSETARQNGKKGGRKPNRNQSATDSLSKREAIRIDKNRKKEKEEKERTAVGSAAAIAAPPACPKCGGRLFHAGTGEDRCLECGEVFR